MEKKYEVIDKIIEYGIYLYIIFMFLSKGEGIRNILIFGNFALWLFTLKHRKNLFLLKKPVSILFWIFSGVTFFSVIFSIDPLYSLLEFKSEIRKSVLLFPVIATVMNDEKKLKRVTYVSFFTLILIVSIGYYSYIYRDIPMLKPDIPLMHVYHNKFAKYLNTLLPIAFILYFLRKKIAPRVILTISLIISVFALILNTSRGGYLAFFSVVCIWVIYLSKTRGYNFIKVMMIIAMVILLSGTLSWLLFPDVKARISMTAENIYTFNDRTNAWTAAMYGFRQRPLFGWGYGKKIFHKDEPFRNTPFKKRPYNNANKPLDDPHNTFLTVLFHQGIIGFIPYLLLILLAIKAFWKGAFKTNGIESYMLVACVSVLVGNYILHSMFSLLKLRYLAVILGLGIAAKGINENSHN